MSFLCMGFHDASRTTSLVFHDFAGPCVVRFPAPLELRLYGAIEI